MANSFCLLNRLFYLQYTNEIDLASINVGIPLYKIEEAPANVLFIKFPSNAST